MLEIKNIPTGLILYAVQQWTPCHEYATKPALGKNTNRFIKRLAVWLILKNETSSGVIKNYRSQFADIAFKCKMSPRSLDTYLAWLRSEDLVHIKGRDLILRPYKELKKYGIDIKEREQTIYYDTTNNQRLADIITAIGIEKMKEKPLDAYWKKINKNLTASGELRIHLVAFGADNEKLDDPEYFRQSHLNLLLKTYREEEPGQSSFYLLHKYINANPDLNFKAATYAKKMGYSWLKRTNPVTKKDESVSMGFCHLKRRLLNQGLITAWKNHVESEYRARKDESIFHHRYVRSSKKTIWFRPDQISINPETFYKPKIAA